MTVKLVGSTSGSVSLQAPASTSGGAHRVLTLPDADATLATTSDSFGKILQVVQTVKTDTFSYNATAFTDITGLSATITPSSSSNKVLVDCRLYLSAGTSAGTSAGKLNFVRGSTNIGQPSGSTSHMATFFSWGSNNYMEPHAMNFLDSPSTTSATTYKIQIGADGTAAPLLVNRYYYNDNYKGISTLTLMEVAA